MYIYVYKYMIYILMIYDSDTFTCVVLGVHARHWHCLESFDSNFAARYYMYLESFVSSKTKTCKRCVPLDLLYLYLGFGY